jgi:hypothetical protein
VVVRAMAKKRKKILSSHEWWEKHREQFEAPNAT